MVHCKGLACVVAGWLGVLALCGSATEARGEDPPVAAARAEFDHEFGQYKDAVRQIEQLQTDYQSADAATRDALNAQLRDQAAAAKRHLDAMVAAAMKLYPLRPEPDPQIGEFLTTVAKFYSVGEALPKPLEGVKGGDSYERALPIIRMLVDRGAAEQEKRLPVWGFLAAFALNDYDLAQKYLEQARAAGALVDPRSLEDRVDQQAMGKTLQLASELEAYRALWAKEQAIRAAEAAADDLPRVRLSTTKGDIMVELFENEAPQAVANFLTLVKQGFYDGVSFHRVLPLFMAQGGDPRGDGTGGPGYAIRCECYGPEARKHFRGSLSMAHAGRDTGGSQFFLTFLPASHLDGKHTVFGRVVDGIDVLGELQKRDPDASAPPAPDRITKAEVLRDRGHEYTFDKLPGR